MTIHDVARREFLEPRKGLKACRRTTWKVDKSSGFRVRLMVSDVTNTQDWIWSCPDTHCDWTSLDLIICFFCCCKLHIPQHMLAFSELASKNAQCLIIRINSLTEACFPLLLFSAEHLEALLVTVFAMYSFRMYAAVGGMFISLPVKGLCWLTRTCHVFSFRHLVDLG